MSPFYGSCCIINELFLAIAKTNSREIRLPNFREIKFGQKLVRVGYHTTFLSVQVWAVCFTSAGCQKYPVRYVLIFVGNPSPCKPAILFFFMAEKLFKKLEDVYFWNRLRADSLFRYKFRVVNAKNATSAFPAFELMASCCNRPRDSETTQTPL